ncbi:MAG: hypothetical protein WCO45_10560 [Pseudanabaena sp. ELA607]
MLYNAAQIHLNLVYRHFRGWLGVMESWQLHCGCCAAPPPMSSC